MLRNMSNWSCLLSLFIYSSVAVSLFVTVDGQPTTDEHSHNLDDLTHIVAELQAEQAKSRHEIAELKAKVTRLEAELSSKTSHDCKSHFSTLF